MINVENIDELAAEAVQAFNRYLEAYVASIARKHLEADQGRAMSSGQDDDDQ
jgi:hypothetical protein